MAALAISDLTRSECSRKILGELESLASRLELESGGEENSRMLELRDFCWFSTTIENPGLIDYCFRVKRLGKVSSYRSVAKPGFAKALQSPLSLPVTHF